MNNLLPKTLGSLGLAFALLAPASLGAQGYTEAPLPRAGAQRMVAEAMGGTPRARALQTGSVLNLPYGEGQPVLVCAPRRTCNIMLDPGEALLGGNPGDPTTWMFGTLPGPNQSLIVWARPRFCDVTTNLVFTTSKRVYDVILDSPPCGGADSLGVNANLRYTSLVRFYDPAASPTTFPSMVPPPAAARPATVAHDGAAEEEARRVHAGYAYRRDRTFPWTPEQVYDDGLQTVVRIPKKATQGEVPALYGVDDDGELYLVNYHYEGGIYTVDRVAPRFVLLMGQSGVKGRGKRLLIERKEEG